MAVSIPDDIMLLIYLRLVRFEDVKFEDAKDKWPAMIYDHHAAQVPFTLAAVCQRWRGLALATPTLWTYFGFPPAESMDGRDLMRFELLRDRAGAAPIDVVFGWQYRDGGPWSSEPSRLVSKGIVDMHLRWKTVVLHVQGSVKSCQAWDQVFESSHWPILESLSLSINTYTTELPLAPRLRRLWLSCHPYIVDTSFIAGGYPLLAALSISCNSASLVKRLLPMLSSQLLELVLVDECRRPKDHTEWNSNRSVFPALQFLTLNHADWLQHIDAPALRKLLLTKTYINEHYEDAPIEALYRFDHLEELQLCGGPWDAIELATLAGSSNITTLSFCSSPSLTVALGDGVDQYRLDIWTLRELTSLNPLIWPCLQRLHFAWFDSGQPAVNAQDIVDFVSARNAKSADSDHGQPATARIVEVVANHAGAPDWLEDKLKELTMK